MRSEVCGAVYDGEVGGLVGVGVRQVSEVGQNQGGKNVKCIAATQRRGEIVRTLSS